MTTDTDLILFATCGMLVLDYIDGQWVATSCATERRERKQGFGPTPSEAVADLKRRVEEQ